MTMGRYDTTGPSHTAEPQHCALDRQRGSHTVWGYTVHKVQGAVVPHHTARGAPGVTTGSQLVVWHPEKESHRNRFFRNPWRVAARMLQNSDVTCDIGTPQEISPPTHHTPNRLLCGGEAVTEDRVGSYQSGQIFFHLTGFVRSAKKWRFLKKKPEPRRAA